MLGYGQTDKPSAIVDYTWKRLADDLAALLDAVGISKAVRTVHAVLTMKHISVVARLRSVMTGAPSWWVGWVFGTRIACLGLPSRSIHVRASCLSTQPTWGSLSVPFLPRSTKYRSVEDVVAMNPAGWGYQLYFSSDEANEQIGNNVR